MKMGWSGRCCTQRGRTEGAVKKEYRVEQACVAVAVAGDSAFCRCGGRRRRAWKQVREASVILHHIHFHPRQMAMLQPINTVRWSSRSTSKKPSPLVAAMKV